MSDRTAPPGSRRMTGLMAPQDDPRAAAQSAAEGQRFAPGQAGNAPPSPGGSGGDGSDFLVPPPSVSLPKGGGAIQGIGEKFEANPVTGTGSLTIPIPVSPGRGGFQPNLSLSYDSGAGNGPFGLGWNLSVPSIRRKTDRGLPRYWDSDLTIASEDSDTYIFAGVEDLIPLRTYDPGTQTWVDDVREENQYLVRRYRPRVEGAFARIERWSDRIGEFTFWKTVSADNITRTYGSRIDSRVFVPGKPHLVFEWLLDEERDELGNITRYDYKGEDREGAPLVLYEQPRTQPNQGPVNRYLKRILYTNLVDTPLIHDHWTFQVVFDYGEHDEVNPTPTDSNPCPVRQDIFSSFRSGFDIRNYRLCKRVLVFHRFSELNGGDWTVVRSTDLDYDESPVASKLRSVQQRGWVRDNGIYTQDDLPPLDLQYSASEIDPSVHPVTGLEDLIGGVDPRRVQWVDLDGEGLPGLLVEHAGAWWYKRNEGQGRLAPARRLETRPSLPLGSVRLVDLDGDGKLDVVQDNWPMRGYHERKDDGSWNPLKYFKSDPNIRLNDPNLRMIDLTGDGHADILITDVGVYTWYPSLTKDGYAPAQKAFQALDENQAPTLVFASDNESIFLADMTGDGLTDLVHIRNGNVSYWPNKGYGRFSGKITISKSPWFDNPDRFDHRRIRLADVDGSGPADLIYLGPDRIRIWANETGNRFSDPVELSGFPPVTDPASVQVTDLLGQGTACLVWSSPLPGDAFAPIRYVDLMAQGKPHLLTGIVNNLGLQTELSYKPSTTYYLQDRRAGQPWATRLAFPVQCLDSVTVRELVTGRVFTNRYAYHHGYFDGPEREYRGFGMVEQWDTQTLPDYSDLDPQTDQVLHFVPPIHTKTWFHTGAWRTAPSLALAYAAEEYQGDSDATALQLPVPEKLVLPDITPPPRLSPADHREAMRALKGRMLRQEVYADDDADEAEHPFTVTEQSFMLRLLQPRVGDRHGAYVVVPSQTVAWDYERDPSDPRVRHNLTLRTNEYGQVERAALVTYPRRDLPDRLTEQEAISVDITETEFINQDGDGDLGYHVGLPFQQHRWELTGPAVSSKTDTDPLSIDALNDVLDDPTTPAVEIPYDQQPDPLNANEKRVLLRQRTTFCGDLPDGQGNLTTALALGSIESRALVYEQLKLSISAGLLTASEGFDNLVTPAMLQDGAYVDADSDGHWWTPSGRQTYNVNHYCQPQAHIDPFGNVTTITWDAYDLSITTVTDAVGNAVTAENDYRVLAPWQVTDPNQQRVQAAFDALGRVTKMAVVGRDGEGDSLTEPTTEFQYELFRWVNDGLPNRVWTQVRETHGDPNSRWLESYTYSGGGGNIVSTKVQAEPGLAPERDLDGNLVFDPQGNLQWAHTDPRWVGTGRTVLDNKGNPVKQYEPFFSTTSEYEDDEELAHWGVTPVLHYDPLGRNIRTDLPNGTFRTVEFDAWKQTTYDENDNVVTYDDQGQVNGTTWYTTRQDLPGTDPEHVASDKAFAHYDTPTVTHLDPLGRAFLTQADNGAHGAPDYYDTKLTLDIQGNPVAVQDAEIREIQRQTFDLLGRPLFTNSADGGIKLVFTDVASQPLRSWRSDDYKTRLEYDELRRPTHEWVQKGADPERLQQRMIYGESLPAGTALADNLIGRPYRTYAGAGLEANDRYDFKGNLVDSSRRFLVEVDSEVDWTPLATLTDAAAIETAAGPFLTAETLATSITLDALDRVVTETTPDSSVTHRTYNEAALLETESINLRGDPSATPIIVALSYNARGQRETIEYGNGTSTSYTYDPDTFRLRQMVTTRSSDGAKLQDLSYRYDPVGNITEVSDAAQDTLYFQNAQVSPTATYTYDPLYRLVQATGREREDALDGVLGYQDPSVGNLASPTAVREYTENYTYDKVGNILHVNHVAPGPAGATWNRYYEYIAGGNRLHRVTASGMAGGWAEFHHDDRGNMISMPHLSSLTSDFRDQIRTVSINGNGDNDVYHYDSSGQRVRKVERRGSDTKERLYIGNFEVYRKYDGVDPNPVFERETVHVTDDARRVALIETRTVGEPASPPPPQTRYRFQLDNHIGTCCVEADPDGNVISYEEFHPYGTTSWRAKTSDIEVSEKRYRYTGKEKDDGTGLYYHGARFYACWLGRWTSVDPLGLADGINPYVYSSCNTIRYNDPTGTQHVPSRLSSDIREIPGIEGGFYSTQLPSYTPVFPWEISEDNATPPPGQHRIRAEPDLGDVGLGLASGATQEVASAPDRYVRGYIGLFLRIGDWVLGDSDYIEPKTPVTTFLQEAFSIDISPEKISEEFSEHASGEIGRKVVSEGEVFGAAGFMLSTVVIGGGSQSLLLRASSRSRAISGSQRMTLIHYTTDEGRAGILESSEIWASRGSRNARYGTGQYFTDIAPEMIGGRTLGTTPPGKMSLGQLSSRLFRVPWNTRKVSSFIEVDVTGLGARQVAPNIWLIESETGLSIAGRVVRSGTTLP